MKTSNISYGFLLAFLMTVGAAHWLSLPLGAFMLISGAILATGFVCLLMLKPVATQAIAVGIGMIVGVLAIRASMHVTTPHDIDFYADGGMVLIAGRISDAPDVRPTVTKYTVDAESLTRSGATMPVRGKILANDFAGWPEYQYGDRVTVRGKLERPQPIDNFAYGDYLSIRNIYGIMTRASVRSGGDKSTEPIGWLIQAIYGVREHFEAGINRIFPEPHASLLAGLLTGSRRGIPKHLSDDFRAAGITHIIAISGYNVTIILALLSGCLFWLPLKRRFPALVIGVALFTVFVGASASVVRAAIMGILGLLALQAGRQTTMRLLILWTAFLMVCWNPRYLWFDAGFQLSFLAVIGITELSEPLKKFFRLVPEEFALRESLVATFAAQIATLPLTIILFRQISLIAPVTNLLVAPLVPLAMLVGFIATVLGFIWLPLGLVVGYVGWAVLHTIIVIAEVCAHLPLAVIAW